MGKGNGQQGQQGQAYTPADIVRMAQELAQAQAQIREQARMAGEAALPAYREALAEEARCTAQIGRIREELARVREERKALGAMLTREQRASAGGNAGNATRVAGASAPTVADVPRRFAWHPALAKAFATGARKPGKPCAYVGGKEGAGKRTRQLAYERGQMQAGATRADITRMRGERKGTSAELPAPAYALTIA